MIENYHIKVAEEDIQLLKDKIKLTRLPDEINHKWTFTDMTIGRSISYINYFKYLSVGIIALSVNLAVLQFLIISNKILIKRWCR